MAVMCEICKCSQWLDNESGIYKSECECSCCEHFEAKPTFKQYIENINPLTIGDLRKAIEGLADDVQILVGIPAGTDLNSDWFNISHNMIRPDVDPDYSAFTLSLVDTYDSRQF